jgi:hypothetical protein
MKRKRWVSILVLSFMALILVTAVNAAGVQDSSERELSEANTITAWNQGSVHMVNDGWAERWDDRERRRQDEVNSRYYPYYYPYYAPYYDTPGYRYAPPYEPPFSPYWQGGTGYPPGGAMLIEVRGSDKGRPALRCYSYQSEWERDWILDQLTQSGRRCEKMPCPGASESVRVIGSFPNIAECYRRLY